MGEIKEEIFTRIHNLEGKRVEGWGGDVLVGKRKVKGREEEKKFIDGSNDYS